MQKIRSLLDSGVNVNELDGSGETALFVAAKFGRAELVGLLLETGADPLIALKGPFGSLGTPLHVAAKAGHVDVIPKEVIIDSFDRFFASVD